jgi:hypothetical protein
MKDRSYVLTLFIFLQLHPNLLKTSMVMTSIWMVMNHGPHVSFPIQPNHIYL